jgi:hypothetical protein
MLATFKTLESYMKMNVVAEFRSIIYVAPIVDKASKSLKDN